jgi:hypothetical protein
MTRIGWTWLVLAALYAAFFSWYTSFGGPLSAEEVAGYMSHFEQRDPAPSAETLTKLKRFMEEDTGDDFVMINVIDMFESPLQVEGVEPGDTSDDVLNKYMAYMYPALFSRASHPVLYGTAANTAMDLMNAEGMEVWTRAAAMRYRSRRDMLEITTNRAFSGSHDFKIAAMKKTIAFPIDPWFQLGDPRIVLALAFGLIGFGLSWRAAARGPAQTKSA